MIPLAHDAPGFVAGVDEWLGKAVAGSALVPSSPCCQTILITRVRGQCIALLQLFSCAALRAIPRACMGTPTPEQRQRWRDANQEKCRQMQRDYNNKNREKRRHWNNEWKARNVENGNAHSASRKAAKLSATPKWACITAIMEIYRNARLDGLTVDHIVPLRHPLVCGLHVENNLRAISMLENSIKGNRYWPDMP